jgi:hypothetical protein
MADMADSHSAPLATFVQWAQAHITGDEKGQAQIFLDRLFIAFGHGGSLMGFECTPKVVSRR